MSKNPGCFNHKNFPGRQLNAASRKSLEIQEPFWTEKLFV